MSARTPLHVVADAFENDGSNLPMRDAEIAIDALTDAGYRIIPYGDGIDKMVEAACQAQAITVAHQDGVTLTEAGYRHGAAERPIEQVRFRECVRAGIEAAIRSLSQKEPAP